MGTPANDWWSEMRQEAEELPAPPPPRPRRAAAIGGAAVAAAVAAGVGWWLTSAEPTTFKNPESARLQPTATAPAASLTVDAEQVRRGHDEFLTTYAAGGPEGFERFRTSCEASARADGRILDFCLAFDLMSDSVAPADAATQARRLALVEAAVPAEPAPASRVGAVRAQLQAMGALPAPVEVAAAARAAPVQAAPAPAPAPAKVVAVAAKKPVAKTAAAPSRCRFLSTPADRLICANPSLKARHDRMRAAYDLALKNGADPLKIDRGQAEWRALRNAADTRAELSALYARRTRELNAAAEEARLTPPN